jgi:hypothetical protein
MGNDDQAIGHDQAGAAGQGEQEGEDGTNHGERS